MNASAIKYNKVIDGLAGHFTHFHQRRSLKTTVKQAWRGIRWVLTNRKPKTPIGTILNEAVLSQVRRMWALWKLFITSPALPLTTHNPFRTHPAIKIVRNNNRPNETQKSPPCRSPMHRLSKLVREMMASPLPRRKEKMSNLVKKSRVLPYRKQQNFQLIRK